jgi:DNA-binding NtrC family response regulator
MFIEPKRDLALRERGLSTRKQVEMRKRIFVVDDDQALRWLIQELLEDEGYEVETASNGTGAFDHLSHQYQRYDVILLDGTMLRLGGLQFLHKVQEQDASLLRSIIVLSTDEEALQQAVCLGIGATLKKPFELEALLALVGQVMCRS